MHQRLLTVVVALLLSTGMGGALAQGPALPAPPASSESATPAPAARAARPVRLPDMQAIADALGVQCEYCHGGAQAVTAIGKRRLDVALEMIVMTAEMNTRVQAAAGVQGTRVDCMTCHRGVPIPRALRDLLLETAVRQSADAAVAQYRDLRSRYLDKQAYDFSENTLVSVAERLANARPDTAITLTELNLEFFPKSVRSYLVKGIAQSRRMESTPDAVETFKKALEIDPNNATVRGYLIQTEPLAKRVRDAQ